jgi:hypothetical protein
MDELFEGLQLEFSQDNTFTFSIEKASKENGKLLLCAADIIDIKQPPFVGKLTFNCGKSFFARMSVNVTGNKVENDKTLLICDVPTAEYDEYQRSYARVDTDIPVELTLLKPDAEDALNPISRPIHGDLKNFSPAGAQVAISKNDVSLVTMAKNLPIYTRLYFTLPNNPKELQIVGKIVKIENSFRNIFFGIQFILKTFGDFQLIEEYYNKLIRLTPGDKKPQEALQHGVNQLLK